MDTQNAEKIIKTTIIIITTTATIAKGDRVPIKLSLTGAGGSARIRGHVKKTCHIAIWRKRPPAECLPCLTSKRN